MNKKSSQITDSILMVRPTGFTYNVETAVNNYYQKKPMESKDQIQEKAIKEFDIAVEELFKNGINVISIPSKYKSDTPDSIFPNNWITTHQDGKVVLYSMFAKNRRRERRDDVVKKFKEEGYEVNGVVDFTLGEKEDKFLEGTGVMILDRVNRKVYCSLSERANKEILENFGKEFGYTPIKFVSYQSIGDRRLPIYHTNVMMALGRNIAIVCLESIDDKKERQTMAESLVKDGKKIIEITEEQVENFAGNMLEVKNIDGKSFMVMSVSAFNSLRKDQVEDIEEENDILAIDIPTIEKYGGGSIRCMMAEIFLPKRK